MNIILLGQRRGMPRSISLGRMTPWLVGLAGLVLLLAGGVFYAGYLVASSDHAAQPVVAAVEKPALATDDLLDALQDYQAEIRQTRSEVSAQLDSFGQRLGTMQAQAIRLDALGGRLVTLAKLDNGEFDFDQPPPLGGSDPAAESESGQQVAVNASGLTQSIAQLNSLLADRERQLQVLESLLVAEDLSAETVPSGRPIKGGWVSSPFGRRHDPMTGKTRFHKGMDFAGRRGTDILAVAAGVVSFAGKKHGYGNVVEIDHGDGLTTRYAHNQKNLVKPGAVVQRGAVIAKLGSTGRSTGPHVHFEVLRDGKSVNPRSFVRKQVK